ncbi:autotransporter outer membrane beta-barrel domain-containing protein [Phreatobacter stygius]|uniref:Autotransporter outer membrane beta-barrel domain-containing protein n=1 Tax=Phreatobacter stygius TaxID=1940610 RepID=A0A4D7B0K8_9HYPH|nr:autotransporter domain-containing protein [Phreatobacter stygius]QCI67184.1 autotransporter outer membrane beta-barrel domain-containing protein [Phreatobacter stygius]
MTSTIIGRRTTTRHDKNHLSSPSYIALALAIGSTALAGLSTPATAADWTGTGSTDWFVIGNWNPAAIPTLADDVRINTTAANATIVSGAAASAQNVLVGDTAGGSGGLTILNAGSVSGTSGAVGNLAGSSGAVLVFGANSAWANSGNLTVGNFGAGMLTMANGGAANNVVGSVGFGAGSTGTVTVTGAGSTWTNTADLTVGRAGTGTLAITNGGAVSNATGYVGMFAGSTGTVTVAGAGSTWTNSSELRVGQGGAGTLKVTTGGTVSATVGYLGNFGHGSATVDGAGSVWNNSSALYVGVSGGGVGALTISGGGIVTDTVGHIGYSIGSTGTVTVNGAGSAWTSSSALFVGTGGTGTLTIANGGTVSSASSSIGSTGTGTVNVGDANSAWTISGSLTIGNFGSGTLTITSGGTVNSVDGVLGNAPGASGTVTVSGANATWANSSSLIVGYAGSGALSISDGGTVSNANGVVGDDPGAIGTATVQGVGSTWITSNLLAIGNSGTGSLDVASGANVSSQFGAIGHGAGSNGEVTITGPGSTWTIVEDLFVGFAGTGALTIAGGGKVSDVFGVIGNGSSGKGAVTVDGAGSTWTSSADLRIGYFGTGTLVISNGGVVNAGGVAIATMAGSAGSLAIGGAAGSAAVPPGTLNAAAIQFGAGTGAINFNHTHASYTFASAISGLGTINQIAGTTILTADSSGFTGATNVSGGRLAVNGSLANSLVTVSGSGILGGNGIVSGIVAQSGGMIAPGNSIGTLVVAGNVIQAAGSTYQVELSSTGQADRINASGTATIANGALLNVVKLDAAPYVIGTHYTVLQANGGVTGTYTLTGDIAVSAFIGLVANYDLTHVYLDAVQTKAFVAVGQTPNQIATAGGVESLLSGNSLYDALLSVPTDAAARAAFDSLSGEVHASARSVMIEDSRFVREAVTNRVRSAFDGVGVVATPVVSYGRNGPQAAPANTAGFAVWGQAFGAWGSIAGDGNAAALRRDIGGFFIGADGLVAERWRVGVAGGYSHGNIRVGARNSSLTSDNYHVGLYAGTQWGDLALRTGLAYAWHDIGASRSVAFAGFADTLKSHYGARTAQAFGELGYRIRAGRAAFEPFANLAYVNAATDGFTETGGAAALTGRSATGGVTFTTLGLRASTGFALDNGLSVTARGMLGWRHAFGATTPVSTLAFAGGSPFSISGVPIAANAAVVEAGVDLNLAANAVIGITYGGQFGSGLTDQTVRGNFAVKF